MIDCSNGSRTAGEENRTGGMMGRPMMSQDKCELEVEAVGNRGPTRLAGDLKRVNLFAVFMSNLLHNRVFHQVNIYSSRHF